MPKFKPSSPYQKSSAPYIRKAKANNAAIMRNELYAAQQPVPASYDAPEWLLELVDTEQYYQERETAQLAELLEEREEPQQRRSILSFAFSFLLRW